MNSTPENNQADLTQEIKRPIPGEGILSDYSHYALAAVFAAPAIFLAALANGPKLVELFHRIRDNF